LKKFKKTASNIGSFVEKNSMKNFLKTQKLSKNELQKHRQQQKKSKNNDLQ